MCYIFGVEMRQCNYSYTDFEIPQDSKIQVEVLDSTSPFLYFMLKESKKECYNINNLAE